MRLCSSIRSLPRSRRGLGRRDLVAVCVHAAGSVAIQRPGERRQAGQTPSDRVERDRVSTGVYETERVFFV